MKSLNASLLRAQPRYYKMFQKPVSGLIKKEAAVSTGRDWSRTQAPGSKKVKLAVLEKK